MKLTPPFSLITFSAVMFAITSLTTMLQSHIPVTLFPRRFAVGNTYSSEMKFLFHHANATGRKVAGSRPDEVNEFFQVTLSFQPH
jgi:hypothetical protein